MICAEPDGITIKFAQPQKGTEITEMVDCGCNKRISLCPVRAVIKTVPCRKNAVQQDQQIFKKPSKPMKQNGDLS